MDCTGLRKDSAECSRNSIPSPINLQSEGKKVYMRSGNKKPPCEQGGRLTIACHINKNSWLNYS